AQHYMNDHERDIIGDAYKIANTIQRDPTLFDADKHVKPTDFFAKLNSLTKDRGLQASYIVDSNGKILASTKQQFVKDPKPPSASDLAQASSGSIVVDATPGSGTVTALIQMQTLKDAYLMVVRQVDPQVFGY